eukprot:5053176-Lingulodinium_polyedra.AAC.1
MELYQPEADISTSAGGVAAGQASAAPAAAAGAAPPVKAPPPLPDWRAWGAGVATPPPSPSMNAQLVLRLRQYAFAPAQQAYWNAVSFGPLVWP